jgi:2-keto-4-pentenoate hydratase
VDPRIAAGTARMLERRRRELDDGATHLGWKAGFGAPAAQEMLGTDRPLVGYLTRERLLGDGATLSLAGMTQPVLEAEVALHLADDVPAGADAAEALAAVGTVGVAIEVADLDAPPVDVEQIVAGNIYHRHVLLGPQVAVRVTSTLTAVVRRDGVEVARTDDPEALTGDVARVLASMADTLAATGGTTAAGDVVITGSVVPPVPLVPGDWAVTFAGLGQVTVRVRP